MNFVFLDFELGFGEHLAQSAHFLPFDQKLVYQQASVMHPALVSHLKLEVLTVWYFRREAGQKIGRSRGKSLLEQPLARRLGFLDQFEVNFEAFVVRMRVLLADNDLIEKLQL